MSETQEILWFIQIAEGKKAGPISLERLKKFAEQKKLLPDTKVRSTQSDATWVLAKTVPGLFSEDEKQEIAPTETDLLESVTVMKKIAEDFSDKSVEKNDEKSAVEIKSDEKKGSSVSSFSIKVGGDQSSSNVTSKHVFKIDTKKSVPKENKETKNEEKKSKGLFGFGVQKSKVKTEEKKADVTAKDSEPEKKKTSDQSVSSIKVSIGSTKEKDKNKEQSSVSAPTSFLISTEPTSEPAEELSQEEFSEPEESDEMEPKTDIAETKLKKYGKKEQTESLPKRKIGILSLLLITLSVLSILVGGIGGIGLFLLSYQNNNPGFGAALGAVVFLFGMILGVVSWSLALLFTQSEQ
ncbi:MAG: DUF4339 domain-containing protein [Planctomycetaceae bacterium]|jgi:hypothetical protein|nr:DUF4339 domain-containing protein [Planctomycetaceae bacterium]